MHKPLLNSAAAIAALLAGGHGPEVTPPQTMHVPSHRMARGGQKEHSKSHTGQAKIRREARRLRNIKRRGQ